MSATSVGNPVPEVALLNDQRYAFAAMVASGLSYRVAAEKAGFDRDYGWDLMQEPAIRQKVIELAAEPGERLKAGIEADLIMMRRAAASGPLSADDIATMELRLKLLMAQAKLRGWIVDKKQVAKASISLSGLQLTEVQEHLGSIIAELDPGAHAEIEDRVRRAEARRKVRRRSLASPSVDIKADECTDRTDDRTDAVPDAPDIPDTDT